MSHFSFLNAAKVFHSDAISSLCAPDFNIKDSEDQTVLALAVWSGYYKISAQLFSSGADINYKWDTPPLTPWVSAVAISAEQWPLTARVAQDQQRQVSAAHGHRERRHIVCALLAGASGWHWNQVFSVAQCFKCLRSKFFVACIITSQTVAWHASAAKFRVQVLVDDAVTSAGCTFQTVSVWCNKLVCDVTRRREDLLRACSCGCWPMRFFPGLQKNEEKQNSASFFVPPLEATFCVYSV